MRFLSYHLGLGDALICSGLVELLSLHGDIFIPCYPHNLKSVQSIYLDNVNVHVLPVFSDDQKEKIAESNDTLRIDGNNFPKGFYKQVGLNWEQRFDSCPVLEASKGIEQYVNDKDPIFIHDDASRGFIINKEGFRIVDSSYSILRYVSYLTTCKEIHCIDSSFLHLVECIPPEEFKDTKFFYHKYARHHSTDYTDCLRHNWIVLNEAN